MNVLDRIEGWSTKQKAGVVLLVLVVLIGVGIGKWVYDMRVAEQEQTATSEPPAPSAEPVSPVGGGEESTEPPASEEPSPSATPTISQEESAKEALNQVVPVWASLDYATTGVDSGKWEASWRDDPAVDQAFVAQSSSSFVTLFYGVIDLNANAKVDTLKHVELVWQQDNRSGWTVEMDRHLTSADGTGVLDETETVAFEFTVEQQDDGTSQIIGFAPAGDFDH